MSVPVPKFMRGPEQCTTCDKEAKLTNYRLDTTHEDTPVLAEYTCQNGHVTGFHHFGRRREAYLEFIEARVKAGELPISRSACHAGKLQ